MVPIGSRPPPLPPPRTTGNPLGNMNNRIYEELNESDQHDPFGNSYANPNQYSGPYDVSPVGHHDPSTFESQGSLNETSGVSNQQDSNVNELYVDLNQVERDNDDNEYQGLNHNGIVYVFCDHTQLFIFSVHLTATLSSREVTVH